MRPAQGLLDIDDMLAAGAPADAAEVVRWVSHLSGPDGARFARIVRVLAA